VKDPTRPFLLFLAMLGDGFAVGLAVVLLWVMDVAGQSDWQVHVRFNRLGEAWPEVLALSGVIAISIVGAVACAWYFNEDVR
jgi:hypothetical protein